MGRGAVHYHLHEQGSGPWARALVHGIPLVSCKIFIIFFSSKLLIFYNFSRKDQFSSSSSSSVRVKEEFRHKEQGRRGTAEYKVRIADKRGKRERKNPKFFSERKREKRR